MPVCVHVCVYLFSRAESLVLKYNINNNCHKHFCYSCSTSTGKQVTERKFHVHPLLINFHCKYIYFFKKKNEASHECKHPALTLLPMFWKGCFVDHLSFLKNVFWLFCSIGNNIHRGI